MSGKLMLQLFRAHWKRFFLVGGIITFSLSLFVSIAMIVANINQQILDQTKPLVGADIIVESSAPLSDEAVRVLDGIQSSYDVQVSTKVEFSTNLVLSGTESKLVQVWGIDDLFPLYGELDITMIDGSTNSGVYVDAETYRQFVLEDIISIGTQEFEVAGIIQSLPATSINLFDEGKRILIPYKEVSATQLTQVGSRVEYETLIKTPSTVSTKQIVDQLKADEAFSGLYRISNANDRIGQIQNITQEFDRFITIVLIITFVLVVTTIYISVRTFFSSQKRYIAIFKLLGQRNRDTLLLYSSLFILCFFVGWILACGVSYFFIYSLQFVELTQEFTIYPYVWLEALYIAVILSVMSLSLPLSNMVRSLPLDLLRPTNELPNTKHIRTQAIISALGIFLIYMINLHDILGGLVFVLGGVALLFFLSGLISVLLKGIVFFGDKFRISNFLRFDGLRSLIVPGNQSILMTIGLLATMTVLVVVAGSSKAFLNQLDIVSKDQPSLYVLNVLPEDVTYIEKNHPESLIYDIILSRIQTINGTPLSEYLRSIEGRAGGGFSREYNVTSVPLDINTYVVGSAPMTGEVSLDFEFSQDLGVNIGDEIGFFIQGRTFDLEVTSFRESVRDGSGPFFFIQFPESQFAQAPKSYFRLVDVPLAEKIEFKNTLLNNVGAHLSFIDTDEIIQTVTNITNRLISVINFLVGCILFFVGISIAVSLDAMKKMKVYKVRIYGYLGATKSMTKRSLLWEQLALFGMALLIAGMLGSVVVFAILNYTDFLSWSWDILGQVLLILLFVFVVILGMIWLLYRDMI